eukprot:CAMPEP_0171023002 /NCGR_PEP_ID=MMETSP0736-20130129/31866_1 /TAXON_ID=186038 /ORGANISM="Fragilariopsis kerguelensis, Strain L26-C5" /LENGTH=447 /DNA_ID=CAMNT_0011462141 /DNA_START=130 /DNA_END=1475 /DNA_ORIENTATION=+
MGVRLVAVVAYLFAVFIRSTQASQATQPKPTSRAFLTKDIKQPDPIPEEGRLAADAIMKTGRLYRYNTKKGEESTVSLCEADLKAYTGSTVSLCEADLKAYTGHKYCVGLNSCGSAIMLMLKTTGLQPGDKVISNAFTFGAVPSAIEHAGGKAIYVESTMDMVMPDLEQKLQDHPDCKHVLISHMRGKVGDMGAIQKLCKKYNAILLEDAAHSLGVRYQGKHTGHVGVACAISSQSYKMINSGEGGFLLTDDPDIAARTAVYAGAYEGLSAKHSTNVPPRKYFQNYPTALPNTRYAAAVIRPQIDTLDERIARYNQRYRKLHAVLEQRAGHYLSIPALVPEVSLMVHDSIQFHLHKRFTPEMIQQFLDECGDRGLLVELFGHATNARNFINWGFAPATDPLPETAKMLAPAGLRLSSPLTWDDDDFETMASVLVQSLEKVIAEAETA